MRRMASRNQQSNAALQYIEWHVYRAIERLPAKEIVSDIAKHKDVRQQRVTHLTDFLP